MGQGIEQGIPGGGEGAHLAGSQPMGTCDDNLVLHCWPVRPRPSGRHPQHAARRDGWPLEADMLVTSRRGIADCNTPGGRGRGEGRGTRRKPNSSSEIKGRMTGGAKGYGRVQAPIRPPLHQGLMTICRKQGEPLSFEDPLEPLRLPGPVLFPGRWDKDEGPRATLSSTRWPIKPSAVRLPNGTLKTNTLSTLVG